MIKIRDLANKELISFDFLLSITNNDPVFTRQLLEAFLLELKQVKMQLKPVLDPSELMVLSRSYHTIHPTLKMFGLDFLAERLDQFRMPPEIPDAATKSYRTSELNELSGMIDSIIQEVVVYNEGLK